MGSKGGGGAYKLQYRYSPWEGSSIAWYTIRSALYIHVEGYIIVYLPNILDIASRTSTTVSDTQDSRIEPARDA